MIKRLPLVIIAMLALVTSCSDETIVFKDKLSDEISSESNQQVLLNSVNYENAGVLEFYEENEITGKIAKSNNDDLAGDYPLTLVAQIDPPFFSGAQNLTASHVDVDGNYAYVAYNTVEDGFAGAMDIIDVSDPNRPFVRSRIYFPTADVNTIKYENGFVYGAGGFDSEKSTITDFNSFVIKLVANNGRFNLGAGFAFGFQEGFNGTDVETTSNSILVTSGKDGYLKSYNKNDVTDQNEVFYEDLRSVAVNGNQIAVLDASAGVRILDQNFNETSLITIGSDFGDFSKRTIEFSGDNIIVAEGSLGAGVYNLSTGNLVEYIPILINPDGVDPNNIVTNAVAVNENIVLMANGAAGLSLAENQGAGNTDLIGIIELQGSINYVESKGDYAFAASGRRGLQIIKLNKPSESLLARCSGLPEYNGSNNLNVGEGEIQAFSGSKRLNRINTGGELLLCGTWTVRRTVNIDDNGLFELNGSLDVGNNNVNRRGRVTINNGAVFRVEGNLNIFGDLRLNDGATIEFIGTGSVVNITGTVTRGSNTQVIGTFDDVQNAF